MRYRWITKYGTPYCINKTDGLKRINSVTYNDKNMVTSNAVYNAISFKFEQAVDCATGGSTTINLQSRSAYILIASGNNYGNGIFFVSQGYTAGVNVTRIHGSNLSISSLAFMTVSITNTGGGTINVRVFQII